MSLIKIQSDQITVTISSLGAELQSVVDRAGTEYMWNGDAAYWTGRAPILFPVAGGMREERYELNGVSYPMPKHGFVRKRVWQVEKAEKDEAVFLMKDKPEGYPFDYELRAIYKAEGRRLLVTYQVDSLNDGPLYFSIGSHEAYAAPGNIEDYTILFDESETLALYELVGNQIKHEPVILAENARELPMKEEYFAIDAMVFRTLKSRGVTLRGNGRKVRVEYPDQPVLMLWRKPGAPFLCIEPWGNSPEFMDTPIQIDRKPGYQCLQKGERFRRTHTIIFG